LQVAAARVVGALFTPPDQAMAMAMKLYAQQPKDKEMEADASEIRLRAERCLGQMMAAQRDRDVENLFVGNLS
jgi:hypothetical protein